MTEKIRICQNCASYLGPGSQAQGICTNVRNDYPNHVFGGMLQYSCSWLRNLNEDDKCGPLGKWWSPRK
jgi:hypothetical protein